MDTQSEEIPSLRRRTVPYKITFRNPVGIDMMEKRKKGDD